MGLLYTQHPLWAEGTATQKDNGVSTSDLGSRAREEELKVIHLNGPAFLFKCFIPLVGLVMQGPTRLTNRDRQREYREKGLWKKRISMWEGKGREAGGPGLAYIEDRNFISHTHS